MILAGLVADRARTAAAALRGRAGAGVTGPCPPRRRLAARIRREGPLSIDVVDGDAWTIRSTATTRRARPARRAPAISSPRRRSARSSASWSALWAATVWTQLGRPTPVRLVELGPGRGTLMADRAARGAPGRPISAPRSRCTSSRPARCCAPPSSAALARRRAGLARRRSTRCRTGPAICSANEFLDALPIRQLDARRRGLARARGGARRRPTWVRLAVAGPPVATLPLAAARMRVAPPGTIVEICAGRARPWPPGSPRASRATAARRCSSTTATARAGPATRWQAAAASCAGRCARKPGEADLSAHVDFAAFARRGARRPAPCAHGPVPQGRFLARARRRARGCRAAVGGRHTRRSAPRLESGVARLIDPAADGHVVQGPGV